MTPQVARPVSAGGLLDAGDHPAPLLLDQIDTAVLGVGTFVAKPPFSRYPGSPAVNSMTVSISTLAVVRSWYTVDRYQAVFSCRVAGLFVRKKAAERDA
ncbi:hypothetical protein [Streptomyces sp. NRRL S-340]|uniref:hypothetical protein n=1 Tax=Streptomyces sp. NRRL S-340 TaxID=1463901 RepID=UPI00131BBCA2|nr:hypothetical protein [Streptomyces sp. NRRL S-340]